MMSTHLSAIIINNGTSSLSGNDGWLFDYTSTDNGDGAIIYNNTAYQVDFSFDVGDTTEAYYILLATDLDEDDNYLEHSDVWEQVESSTYNGSGESLKMGNHLNFISDGVQSVDIRILYLFRVSLSGG